MLPTLKPFDNNEDNVEEDVEPVSDVFVPLPYWVWNG